MIKSNQNQTFIKLDNRLLKISKVWIGILINKNMNFRKILMIKSNLILRNQIKIMQNFNI
jgi:hypothetical protein